MEAFATPYPVFFNDGDKEAEKGIIGIHSCLTFKRFQSMVGQKTGLPSAQLATVFVCKRTVNGAEKKQNIPINEKTNFGIILSQHNPSKERDCFFLVSLKRSKKERKASKKRVEPEAFYEEPNEKMVEETPTVEDGAKAGERCDVPEKAEVQRESRTASSAELTASQPVQVQQSNSRERLEREPVPMKDSKSNSHDVPAAPQASAWKTGSILQRLSSADGKTALTETTAASTAARAPEVVAVPRVSEGFQGKQEKTSGMISPTSVLDPSQLRNQAPAIAPPRVSHGAAYSHGSTDKAGGFSPFGHDFGGMDLRALVQDAMASNHLKTSRWCKFCAFCRERNMASAPFHWCVDDQVVSGFRGPNPAGPIGARAMKHSVAAA